MTVDPVSEWTSMKRAGELPADAVFFIVSLPSFAHIARAIHVEECRHPGCSGKHLWKNRLVFDDLVMPPRVTRARVVRHAGHKHVRAMRRRARITGGAA